jgi:16S rRNA (cytosine967-C5)-methyltransferase
MAERMGASGRVHAWDVHEHRVALIRAAALRLGLENVRPAVRDARKRVESMRLSMDAVLVDAPCSGLGVIAEKPDIKYRKTEEELTELPRLQLQILSACAEALKVGGLLVYATCTILPGENEGVVRAFLAEHPNFEPDRGDGWLPQALRARLDGGMLQVLPHRDGMDGFFIARMRRKGI